MDKSQKILLAVALKWRRAYDDSNPDIGFGPSLEWLLEELIEDAELVVSDPDKYSVLDLYREKYGSAS